MIENRRICRGCHTAFSMIGRKATMAYCSLLCRSRYKKRRDYARRKEFMRTYHLNRYYQRKMVHGFPLPLVDTACLPIML